MSIRDFVARRLKPLSSVPIPSAPLSPPPLPEEITRLVDPPAFNTRESDPEVCAENDSPFFHWDIETRSVAKLGKGKFAVGVRAYAEHPSTEVLCVAFARGDGGGRSLAYGAGRFALQFQTRRMSWPRNTTCSRF